MGGTCNTHDKDDKYTKFWLENLNGREHSEDLSIDGKIILECEHGNEALDTIKNREFHE
jgi:hypothetical protein